MVRRGLSRFQAAGATRRAGAGTWNAAILQGHSRALLGRAGWSAGGYWGKAGGLEALSAIAAPGATGCNVKMLNAPRTRRRHRDGGRATGRKAAPLRGPYPPLVPRHRCSAAQEAARGGPASRRTMSRRRRARASGRAPPTCRRCPGSQCTAGLRPRARPARGSRTRLEKGERVSSRGTSISHLAAAARSPMLPAATQVATTLSLGMLIRCSSNSQLVAAAGSKIRLEGASEQRNVSDGSRTHKLPFSTAGRCEQDEAEFFITGKFHFSAAAASLQILFQEPYLHYEFAKNWAKPSGGFHESRAQLFTNVRARHTRFPVLIQNVWPFLQ